MNTNNCLSLPVTHVITGLDTGGAEIMLSKLLHAIDRARYPSRVISLTNIGEIGQRIQTDGIEVTSLGLSSGKITPGDISRLAQMIRIQNPAVVQTWMYHADLLGGLAAKKAGIRHIAWNIRNSTLDLKNSKATTLATVGICSILSHFVPEKIVACSQAAVRIHQNIGYDRNKMLVIPNGFDLANFFTDPEAGLLLRRSLGIGSDVPVVGLAARFDRQKDHATFIRSARHVLQVIPNTHFLMCGEGVSTGNAELEGWIEAAGAAERFHLLGRITDMRSFHSACSVAVSSSAYGESFSNVLGEAMACGIPCVSTNVGGAEEVLGEMGKIVPPGDPELLGQAIVEILELSNDQRLELGRRSVERVQKKFEINMVARLYMDLWNAQALPTHVSNHEIL